MAKTTGCSVYDETAEMLRLIAADRQKTEADFEREVDRVLASFCRWCYESSMECVCHGVGLCPECKRLRDMAGTVKKMDV